MVAIRRQWPTYPRGAQAKRRQRPSAMTVLDTVECDILFSWTGRSSGKWLRTTQATGSV
jgi:hypothetical protein